MVFRSKKQLKRLNDKQLFEDIKKYIKSSHSFYETRVPELKVLAKRLHEEYTLKDFYPVFDKFWGSGSARQMSLAIYALQLYKDNFDLTTWKFVKDKLKEIKSWDKIDSVGINIIGEILITNPVIGKELQKLTRGNNIWIKRAAIMAMIPLIRKNDYRLAIEMLNITLYDKEEHVQKANGILLREIGEKNPDILRRYIKDNINMPVTTFFTATEIHKELRNLKELGKEESKGGKFIFWK